MRSKNKGLEPRERFAPQQQKPVRFENLVEQTWRDLFYAEISAKQLAKRFSPFFKEERLPLYEAVEALEALRELPGAIQYVPEPWDLDVLISEDDDEPKKVIGAAPRIIQVLKAHLDVLAVVDAVRRFDLSVPFTSDVGDIPDEILIGYAVDWERVAPYADRVTPFPLAEAQELGEKLFGSREPDVVVSPYVLENNRYLRGYYTFAYMLEEGPMTHSLPKVLGEVFFADAKPDAKEPGRFFLFAMKGNTRALCVMPLFRVIAHGQVGDKYWVFFLMT